MTNNSAVKGLEPASVFGIFEKMDAIPRGSGNEKAVSDFLMAFAKEHGLAATQDQAWNVVIRKPGTPGYEQSPGVVIQGHMDMVCEKAPGVEHDFEKDPIQLFVNGDYLHAGGTTLGGDDGIAVAMGLAVLAADNIPHPPLELLVTTNEETGMDGAHALDPAMVLGRRLINIDSEEEGILTVSCAGGCTTRTAFAAGRTALPAGSEVLRVTVKGLLGGHSGIEINKGRGNANKLLARLLSGIAGKWALCSFDGGSKHNAIPREASAVIAADGAEIRALAKALEADFARELQASDPDVKVLVEKAEAPKGAIEEKTAERLLRFLDLLPDGVQSMSIAMPGLVESSMNLGVVRTGEETVEAISSIRSSVGSRKENLIRQVRQLAALTGGSVSRESDYPEWSYNPDSMLRERFVELFRELFGKDPAVNAIHAGLECAIFAEKFGGEMDMISFGPTMHGVHTAQEELSISSVQRSWKYLLAALASLK